MGSNGPPTTETPFVSSNGPKFDSVDKEIRDGESLGDGPFYWWRTSGQDLSRMLVQAGYSEECRRQFLDFYRDVICPLLGGKPEPSSQPTAAGWDGNPFEYSFEFKGSTKKAGVRFILDLTELRPARKDKLMDMTNVNQVLEVLRKRSPLYDDTWHRAMERWYTYADSPLEKQKDLARRVGIQTQAILGFDINEKILEKAPGKIPVMGKSYFPPNYAAVDHNLTPFQSLSIGLRILPDIGQYPNLLRSMKLLEDYVEDNPRYQDSARGMAPDLVPASLARIKIYMRYLGDSFDEIWDFYTLGGRIPGLESDKEKIRDLIELITGKDYDTSRLGKETWAERKRRHIFRSKPHALYFSLTPDKPYPVPKLYYYPAQKAPNDEAIAQGADAWMAKYGWQDGGSTVEERVQNVFTHRRLDEKPGIITFIGIGRKENSSDLSLQIYVTPELYETPRY
ncbi:4-O-dimethylallyl-L-tyrosine synthase [Cytospora mali]|uniref:4-O-dimethylallyl-L-tyrosine synthase n=1 Tax=Cytospora mali TaxID=578113 RepID=A0A194WC22_CYTMA|nr:4-O-dimethylallyl-L-tyrosine synthase [Valsa mali]